MRAIGSEVESGSKLFFVRLELELLRAIKLMEDNNGRLPRHIS